MYIVALAARALLTSAPPYGDEAVHYAVARHLWQDDSKVYYIGDAVSEDYSVFFWQRPLFSLVLAPAAHFGFEAYRVGHIVLASLIPVLVGIVIHRLVRSSVLALIGGAATALHPLFVLWGARVFPDTLATLFCLAFLAAWLAARPWVAATFAVAAAWTKEPAALVVLFVSAVQGYQAVRHRLAHGRFPAPSANHLALPAALALSPVPLVLSLFLGARVPGWTTGGEPLDALRAVSLSLLFLPLLVMGLFIQITRIIAAAALLLIGFFVAYAGIYDHNVESWYGILPSSLVLITVLVVAHQARIGPRKFGRSPRIGPIVVVLALLPVAAAIGTPFEQRDAPGMDVVLPPSSASLAFTVNRAAHEGSEIVQAADAVDRVGRPRLLTIDLNWVFKYYPFAEPRERITSTFSEIPGAWGDSWRPIIEEAERPDTVLLIQRIHDRPSPYALFRETYADCLVFENAAFAVFDAAPCAGAGETIVNTLTPDAGGNVSSSP